ncbi:MAG: phosphate/phosphite/phosphonate ABC transporter substrate-binding protein [Desulfobulbaceae bacterium]|nr:phosphate/phosphite/phosphonate ABC transporter substrate-binding protein [Desulfobulbaceae bacterium]HIJ79146.1 phosphate/phosphite/phosphonate ABC transporter substrate-binding protein [Deltaproteobacteria bacterium]
MTKKVFLLCSMFFLLSATTWAFGEEINRQYLFAVVPQIPAPMIQHSWKPLLDEISQDTGYKFELKFFKSIPEFEQGFLEGKVDFAYMNPYHQVMAAKAQGYRPLIRDNSKKLVGLLVVRKDSPIQHIQDLNGKELAFPSPNALAASLYMRALLIESEHINFTANYVKTHSNVYRHVLLKKAAAGGGVNKTLKKEPKEFQDQLRILYTTPAIPSHPISVHPRVPESVARKVSAAIMKLAQDTQGRRILEKIAIAEPIPADYERDYKPLALLGLEKYLGTD